MKNYMASSLDKSNLNPNSEQIYHSTELLPLKPENVLVKYPQEELDLCWDAMCINIIQNYQRGKGTVIKNFGTFTYKYSDLNLEGTTNEVFRDKKLRCPIFIVSKDFNINIRPGEYNHVSGIRYFIAKENKNINIIKLNYSEIAFSLSMSKDKVENIIKCLISHINNAIEQKKFKNKKMGLIGSLVLKHNILAVKFDENFENSISGKNKMFNNLRSQVSLDKNLDGAKKLNLGNFPNIFQTSENLKARNSLVTQCYPSAKKFLKNKYNIIIDDKNNKNTSDSYTKTLNSTNDHRYNFFTNTNKFFTHGRNYPFKFLNDVNSNNSSDYTSTKTTTKKSEEEKRNNPLFKLDNSILKSLSFFKGSMIKDSKELDVNKTGSISKEKAIYMLMKNIPELKFDSAKDIIEYYFITDQIDYMKLIALLIKGSKNCFLKKKGYFDFTKFLFKNTNINFNINRNFNFKNIIRQQKNKKLAQIAEANKDQQKLKELET